MQGVEVQQQPTQQPLHAIVRAAPVSHAAPSHALAMAMAHAPPPPRPPQGVTLAYYRPAHSLPQATAAHVARSLQQNQARILQQPSVQGAHGSDWFAWSPQQSGYQQPVTAASLTATAGFTINNLGVPSVSVPALAPPPPAPARSHTPPPACVSHLLVAGVHCRSTTVAHAAPAARPVVPAAFAAGLSAIATDAVSTEARACASSEESASGQQRLRPRTVRA